MNRVTRKKTYLYIFLYLIAIGFSLLTIKAANDFESIKTYTYLLISFLIYFKAYTVQKETE